MKHFLRFKCKENPPLSRQVHLWSRVALVVDSEIPNVKYLLEVTEKGFELNEFLSRMMRYKRDGERVVSWMPFRHQLSEAQVKELTNLTYFLKTNARQWKSLFKAGNEERYSRYVEIIQTGMLETKHIL